MEEYAPTHDIFSRELNIPAELSETIYRVCEKLGEAVEDFRIDFEDGFGNRPDERRR